MTRQEARAAAEAAWIAFATARDQQHDTAATLYTAFLVARDAAVQAERAEKAARRAARPRQDQRIRWRGR